MTLDPCSPLKASPQSSRLALLNPALLPALPAFQPLGPVVGSGEPRKLTLAAAGFTGGVFNILVGYPFDLVAVRIATDHQARYRTSLHCLIGTARTEGFTALYKGASLVFLLRSFLSSALYSSNHLFQQLLWGHSARQARAVRAAEAPNEAKHEAEASVLSSTTTSLAIKPDTKLLSTGQLAISGGCSGLVLSLVQTPLEVIKARLQVQTHHVSTRGFYPGPVAAGLAALRGAPLVTASGPSPFRGPMALLYPLPAMALQLGIGMGIYFSVYDLLANATQQRLGTVPHWVTLSSSIIFGGLAGETYWLITYPFFSMRNTMILDPVKANTVPKAFRHIVARRGITGLYRGLGPVLLRAFPANAASFFGYELFLAFTEWI